VNFGHSGIELASTKSTSYHGVHHVVVERNDVSAGESGYMHAFGVYGLPGETTDNVIRRNYFHDFTSVSHAGGSDNHFYSNIFIGVKLIPHTYHKKQPYALDIAPWSVNGNAMEARNLYIVNNTMLNTEEFSIQVVDDNIPNSPGNLTNNVIANNLFGQYGYDSGVGGEVALDVNPDITGTLFVKNNAFWDNSATVARFKDPSPVLYDIIGLESCPNTTPDTCDANVKVNDPGFVDYANRDLRLSSGSLLKASGTNAYAAALGSGFVDFYGNPWHASTPSIGAIQYEAAAPANVSAGRAPTYSSNNVLYETSPSTLTDGAATYYVGVGDANESVYAQIDLGAIYDVSKVKMWHFFADGRTYKDVIVQLSQTADFSSYVTTVFNNDKDNSAGQGYGVNAEYAEGAGGKTVSFQPISARYVRFWIGGNHTDPYNQFVELQVYGTTP
jgi:predicted RecA/RadA family phage recombinase